MKYNVRIKSRDLVLLVTPGLSARVGKDKSPRREAMNCGAFEGIPTNCTLLYSILQEKEIFDDRVCDS